MKMVSRGDTTVVDAYLTPILRRYIDRVAAAFEGDMGGKLMFMQSSGGLTGAGRFQGKDAILSGPAGGVVGAVEGRARSPGRGGSSASTWAGPRRTSATSPASSSGCCQTAIAGVRITAPMMNIHTVAAGGGSILSFDGARMRVGPESAGANPGPACLRARRAAGGDRRQRADRAAAAGVLSGDLRAGGGPAARRRGGAGGVRGRWRRRSGKPAEAVAEGFLRIAVENMANAIKKISVQRGYDVSGYCLTVFGGAGAQHACAIADTLGMETCLIHPMASLLSAYGMGLADIRATRTQAVEAELDAESRLAAAALLDALGSDAQGEVEAQGVAAAQIRLRAGAAPEGEGDGHGAAGRRSGGWRAMRAAFQAAHRARFGFDPGEAALVIEAVEAEAVGEAADLTEAAATEAERPEAEVETALVAPVFLGGDWVEARFVRREAMRPGDRVSGPAVLVEPHTSILVEPGWQARVTGARPRGADAGGGAAAAGGGGDAGRSGDARGVQQPLHVDRRADGGGAGEHRRQRDDQGAAGFLLRGVRRGGRSHRQRAAHAGASRVDGGEREGDHRAEPGDGGRGTSSC